MNIWKNKINKKVRSQKKNRIILDRIPNEKNNNGMFFFDQSTMEVFIEYF